MVTSARPVPVVTTPEADDMVDAIDDWWRANRLASPNLFRAEFNEIVSLLGYSPVMGKRHVRRGIPGLRRSLLRATRVHVYYVFDGQSVIIIGAGSGVRRRGPRLIPP